MITAIPLFYYVQGYIFFQAMRLELWQRIRKHIYFIQQSILISQFIFLRILPGPMDIHVNDLKESWALKFKKNNERFITCM